MGHIDYNRKFGRRLKGQRKLRSLRQKDAALELRIGIHTLQSYEQGKTQPDLELLADMCRLYRVSADYLIGLDDAENGEY